MFTMKKKTERRKSITKIPIFKLKSARYDLWTNLDNPQINIELIKN